MTVTDLKSKSRIVWVGGTEGAWDSPIGENVSYGLVAEPDEKTPHWFVFQLIFSVPIKTIIKI